MLSLHIHIVSIPYRHLINQIADVHSKLLSTLFQSLIGT